jgi:uncharacterized protein YajQ (UPF0234 family)
MNERKPDRNHLFDITSRFTETKCVSHVHKVQTAIQGEQLRVTGEKRDDLQQVMQLLKQAELSIQLQFNNFRD